MKLHLYTPVYAFTLLLSAALLFVVQPMFSKMVLPLLGGTPQVWNTAMLFFQVMLLAGYAYAHGTSRFLSVRVQSFVHMLLLIGFAFVLPIAIPDGWIPPLNEDPTLWQLSLMAMTVGGPFFILAGSAPMLQRWFAHTDHPDANDPYFLYGASNLGSVTALLAYPLIIEPLFALDTQSNLWSLGYYALLGCTLCAALLVIWEKNKPNTPVQSPANDQKISWSLRGKWLLLAFIPSSLMLGVTTYITTDIASVPLLWIIPLTLYISTFIIVFSRKPLISKKTSALIFGFLTVGLLAHMVILSPHGFQLIFLHLALFFFAALTCHLELAASRPQAGHLTEFYLMMSLGGALGGFFNAIIAPQFFIIPFEYAIALAGACFMRYASAQPKWKRPKKSDIFIAIGAVTFAALAFYIEPGQLRAMIALIMLLCLVLIIDQRWLAAVAVSVCLIFFTPGHNWGQFIFENTIHQDRSFFGILKVADVNNGQRLLLHGTTNHGTQALDERYKMIPLSYYGPNSPVKDVFDVVRKPDQNVAILGLGVGVTACFSSPGRHFDFFEIDPHVARIAENRDYFTFLSDCGSPYKIILGDARLTLNEQPENRYDVILVDVYSSDNIPVHLITREAITMYLQKLKPDGILAFNVSNNYMDIEPVVAEAGQHLEIPAYARMSKKLILEDSGLETYTAHFAALTKNEAYIRNLEAKGWSPAMHRKGVRLWTDRYSNILSVLGTKTGVTRMKDILKAEQEAAAQE